MPERVFTQTLSDVNIVPHTMSVTDNAMRRPYRLIDMGELDAWRVLANSRRARTKCRSAMPDEMSEVRVAVGWVLKICTGIHRGSNRKEQRWGPNDDNAKDRRMCRWSAAKVAVDIVPMILNNTV